MFFNTLLSGDNFAAIGEQTLNKIATVALSSLLKGHEHLDVQVKTSPEEITIGKLSGLFIDGEGLLLETDLRVQQLQIALQNVAVSPLKALRGNLVLTETAFGQARIVLTEKDLNCAVNSPALRAQLSVLDTYLDNGATRLTVPEKYCHFHAGGKVGIDAHLNLEPGNHKKQVEFTTQPAITNEGRGVELGAIQYTPGKEVEPELTDAFLDKARQMLDLRHFEKDGLHFKLTELTVEPGRIVLGAIAELSKLPRLT
ncbi:MAG: DUF2993 domain-containing protein [Cyanobacteria bacterium P01_H01_bin.15]